MARLLQDKGHTWNSWQLYPFITVYSRCMSAQTLETPLNGEEAIQLSAHILNNVDIPIGVVPNDETGRLFSDYIQWASIKDLASQKWYFANYENWTGFVRMVWCRSLKAGNQAYGLSINCLIEKLISRGIPKLSCEWFVVNALSIFISTYFVKLARCDTLFLIIL